MANNERKKQLAVITIYLLAVLTLLKFSGGNTGDRFSGGHKDVNCSRCHTFVAQTSSAFNGDFITNRNCLECHEPDKNMNNLTALNFHRNPQRNCLDCHSFHKHEAIRAGEKTFLFNYENQNLRTLCLSCHSYESNLALISEGHRRAAEVYHNDFIYLSKLSPSESCLICHSNSASANHLNKSNPNLKIPGINNHSSHPMGIQVIKGKGNNRNRIRPQLDPRIVLLNDKIECQTCHSLTSQNDNFTIQFENQYDFCLGCHEHLPG